MATFPPGFPPAFPDLASLPNPGPTDPEFIKQRVIATFAARAYPPFEPTQGDIDYWVGKGTNPDIYSDNVTRLGWNAYWEYRILITGTPADQGGSSGSGGGSAFSISYGGANGALVNKQLNLLEDDIVYRLSLLCVNVLQPLKDKYPNIVVISGFRQVNNGVSQHELGEAVDLQIQNQTDAQLFEVADYIAKFLHFDQLVLNWTDVGDGQGWIHVSFSPNSLREQVLTKDFADSFHTGLFLCQALAGEEAAQALRDQADSDAKILKELQSQQARSERLGVKVQDDTGGSASGADPTGPPAVLPLMGGGPDGTVVQFDHEWSGKVENQLRDILSTGLAGLDGSNGQAVVDQMNTLGGNYAGAEFQLRHDDIGYRTYGFGWFYVSYIPRDDDGTGFYQIVEFGTPPSGN